MLSVPPTDRLLDPPVLPSPSPPLLFGSCVPPPLLISAFHATVPLGPEGVVGREPVSALNDAQSECRDQCCDEHRHKSAAFGSNLPKRLSLAPTQHPQEG